MLKILKWNRKSTEMSREKKNSSLEHFSKEAATQKY